MKIKWPHQSRTGLNLFLRISPSPYSRAQSGYLQCEVFRAFLNQLLLGMVPAPVQHRSEMENVYPRKNSTILQTPQKLAPEETNPFPKTSSRHAHENLRTLPLPACNKNTMSSLRAAVRSDQSRNLSTKRGMLSKVSLPFLSRPKIDKDYDSDRSAASNKYSTHESILCTRLATIQKIVPPGDSVFISERESCGKKGKMVHVKKELSVPLLSSQLGQDVNWNSSNLCSSFKIDTRQALLLRTSANSGQSFNNEESSSERLLEKLSRFGSSRNNSKQRPTAFVFKDRSRNSRPDVFLNITADI